MGDSVKKELTKEVNEKSSLREFQSNYTLFDRRAQIREENVPLLQKKEMNLGILNPYQQKAFH